MQTQILTSMDFSFSWVGDSHSSAVSHSATEVIACDFDYVKRTDLDREKYDVFEAEDCGYPFHLCNGDHEVGV